MYLGAHPLERILSGYQHRDFTLTERVATEFRVVIFYISLLIFPHPSRLNLDYDFPLSHSLFEPITTLLSIVAIAVLIGLAFYMLKKQRLMSFCILWFLGNLVIESSVIGLEIIFEHRAYLPSMFISLMAVTLAYRYAKPKWLRVGVLCAVVMVCCVWTYERNSVWADDVALWKDCVEKSPNKARPHYNLGLALAKQDKLEEAISHFSKALKIKPDYVKALTYLGLALTEQGKLEEAISHYSTALKIKPDYVEAHNNLGLALAKQGKLEEAISHFSTVLKIKPDYVKALNNLGLALAKQGKLEEAISHYSKALKIKPDYAEPHYNLGLVLAKKGKLEEAISHYSTALKIKPDYVEALNNLGLALAKQGKLEEAISHFSTALKIKPDYVKALNNLKVALAEQAGTQEEPSKTLTAP
jgi:tetratricopeptide (TPR) repeat protein